MDNFLPLENSGVKKRKGIKFPFYEGTYCNCGRERLHKYRNGLVLACSCKPPVLIDNKGNRKQL